MLVSKPRFLCARLSLFLTVIHALARTLAPDRLKFASKNVYGSKKEVRQSLLNLPIPLRTQSYFAFAAINFPYAVI